MLRGLMGFLVYWLVLYLLDSAVDKLFPRLFVEFEDDAVIFSYEVCAMIITLLLGFAALRPATDAGSGSQEQRMIRAKEFLCPECGQQVRVSWVDGVVKRCPRCGKTVRIPEVPISTPTNVAQSAAPNGGPATQADNSGATEGPPSVS